MLLMLAKVAPDVLPRVETWRMRIVRMFSDESDPMESLQANNALQAIKNGAISANGLPAGPGNGVLKHYIPEAYADFYFAALVEEGGLPMAIIIIMLYMWLFFRFMKTGLSSDELFATYLAMGIGAFPQEYMMRNILLFKRAKPHYQMDS